MRPWHIVICVVSLALILLIVSSSQALPFLYSEKTVSVYGKDFPASSEAIVFSGDEVGEIDELAAKLKDFKNLWDVDLGSYSVNVGDVARIREECGGVTMKFRTHVNMYGIDVDTEQTEIDLSGVGMSSVGELADCLPYLPRAAKVVSEDSTITREDRLELVDRFPGIEFDIASIVSICGKNVKDTSVDVDLRGCAADDSLLEDLKKFPMMKSVDLHDSQITPDLQLALTDAYPDVDFKWDVELGGERYDSSVEDLDLSGNRALTFDEIRNALPLFCNLKRVNLADCGFSNEELAEFRDEFTDIKIVWRLYMGKWSLMTDAVAFSVLIYTYNYTALTSADIEVLKYCTDLQALDLGHQKLTDLTAIGEYLPELRILILADNTVSDLSPLAKLKHLHYLELFVNPNLNDLSPLGACKEMVDLNISHLYTVSDISALLDFPMLERLWIEHTAVSEADIQLLKNTYPNATVIDQGYGSVDQGWRTHARYYAMIDMYFDTTYISEEFSKYDSAD